ncbi:MAG: hypothetical protein HRU19_30365 [Pseudobacteriovorax sp.]|nr:hypothetical protein [Pseudobacteriovorax sp.]
MGFTVIFCQQQDQPSDPISGGGPEFVGEEGRTERIKSYVFDILIKGACVDGNLEKTQVFKLASDLAGGYYEALSDTISNENRNPDLASAKLDSFAFKFSSIRSAILNSKDADALSDSLSQIEVIKTPEAKDQKISTVGDQGLAISQALPYALAELEIAKLKGSDKGKIYHHIGLVNDLLAAAYEVNYNGSFNEVGILARN